MSGFVSGPASGPPAEAAIRRVLDTVDYLRVTVTDPGAPEADGREWLRCDRLVSDPDALAELARSTRSDRGTDRDDVSLSLFVQGYAFRVASLVIGAWFLDGVVLDVDPAVTSVALGRGRPNAVRLDRARLRRGADGPGGSRPDGHGPGGDGLGLLHEALVEGHLAPLVANARRAVRIGESLLWSNVGASCASSFGAFMDPLPARRAEIRQRLDAFLATARPELRRSGESVHLGPTWAWQRRACCLWYRTESATDKCADCSLWSDDERRARYDRILAEVTP